MKNLFLLVALFLSTETLIAQLSQIERFYPFSFPNSTNPANTGLFLEENRSPFFRIQSNSHFEQDQGLKVFNTELNLDYQLAAIKRDYLGLGIDYKLQKSIGESTYENTYKIRASYQKHLGKQVKDFLSFGINVGLKDANATIYRVWYYQQEHGISWIRPSDKSLYQVGLIHKMQILVDDSSNNLYEVRWQHWAGIQGHGEWELSRKFQLNFLVNYQYSFYGAGNFSKHLLGGTIATAYTFGKRRTQKLILGVGAESTESDVNNKRPLTYNFFAGYAYNNFRIMAHFSFRYDVNYRTTNRTQISQQFGLSLAYHVCRAALWWCSTLVVKQNN
jgi:hypothetical protein